MSTEKIREEFQEWFDRHVVIGFKCEEDAAWAAWQASRAAIEVELPVPYESFSGVFHAEDGEDPDISMSAHDVRQAIESLGLKVKP